jgi:hypothetical protein
MSKKEKLAFEKINYILMLVGIIVLIIGFFIMTLDTEDYGFGFLGITLGPIVVMLGYIIEFFAIFHKSKK